MSTCQLFRAFPDRPQCAKLGTNRIVMGCVHEHIRTGVICDEHVQSVVNRVGLSCDPCSLLPEGAHICVLQGRVMA